MAKKKDRMAWFKMDAGAFITETSGYSSNHVSLYIKLLCAYWAGGHTLPETAILKRRLGVIEETDNQALSEILQEFFPLNDSGKHCHKQLDEQLADVIEFAEKQSSNASRPRTNHRSKITAPSQPPEDEDNF